MNASVPLMNPTQTPNTPEQAIPDRPFNGFRIARTERARALVADVLGQLQSYEQYFNVRKRARKPNDQQRFEQQVEALVCDLIHREISEPGAWVSVPFSKRALDGADRYRAQVLSKTLPTVIRLMAKPEMDFLEYQIGQKNPFAPALSRQTVIRATERLRTRIADYQLTRADLGLNKTEEIIILKDTKEDYWDAGRWLQYKDTPQTLEYRRELASINEWLERADIDYVPWGATLHPVDVTDRRLSRYFNNRSFEQGGRLFGGFWQPLSKSQRRIGIRIDGEPVATLDYGQMMPRILYGSAGAAPHFHDAYAVPGLEGYRDGAKKVFNAMLHADAPLGRKPRNTADLLPKKLKIAEIASMIMTFHAPVAGAFYAGKGLYLTYQESRILLAVLKTLMDQGITALPIHDAVIVAESKKEQAKEIMLKVFKDLTGIEGLVNEE